MSSRVMCVAVLLAAVPAVGCGTVSNLARTDPATNGKVPFGGVKQDLAGIQDVTTAEPSFAIHPKARAENHPHWAVALFCAADLPFSLVGDFVTWPYVWAYSVVNKPVPVPPIVIADPAPVPPPAALPPVPATKPMPLPTPPVPLPKGDGPADPERLPKPARLPEVGEK